MINVDLQQLVQALDADTRRDLEGAAERCLQRGGNKILVEDLLLGLLERPHGLLARALQDAEVDAGALASALQPRGEHSASRNPVFSAELVQWLQDALLVANLELGQSQVEQAALILQAEVGPGVGAHRYRGDGDAEATERLCGAAQMPAVTDQIDGVDAIGLQDFGAEAGVVPGVT